MGDRVMYRGSRTSAGSSAGRVSGEKPLASQSHALCVDNKDINSSQVVEVEAHVSVTTNVVLEDLQVTGDCDIIVSGNRVGELPKSKRKVLVLQPKNPATHFYPISVKNKS